MATESLSSLHTLLTQAQAQRDTALRALRQTEAAAQAAQGQADQLGHYRTEYHQRWTLRFRDSGTPELLQCYLGFAERLDQAIAQQGGVLQQALARVRQAADQLLAREQRVAAVAKLIERRSAVARLAANRSEQRLMDESAARFGSAARAMSAPL